MNEIWKDVRGFEGLYQVSNLGNIKSSYTNKTLTPSNNGTGYYYINLRKNKANFRYYAHRLVAQTFLDNPNNYPCINHKDENRKNNSVDNLEWCTYEHNNNYGTHRDKLSKSGSKAIVQWKDGKKIKEWESAKVAGLALGIQNQNIAKVLKGLRNTAGGYEWTYK